MLNLCNFRYLNGILVGNFISLLLCLAGCQRSSQPITSAEPPSTDSTSSAPVSSASNLNSTSPSTAESTTVAAADRKEYWDAIFFADQKVGYLHTVSEPIVEDGRKLVRITADSELNIKRFAQSTQQKLRYTSWETPEGEVVRFESAMTSGDSDTAKASLEANGVVRNDQIELQLVTLGQTQKANLPWDKSWGGYFAMEQSLERKPLEPGEQRTLRALMPGFNQTAEVELSAGKIETTETLDGPRDLLRVAMKITLAGNAIQQTIWTDPQGQTIKTVMPALKQVTYRTTKEQALAKSSATFDLGERTIVKVSQAIPNPHDTQHIVYRATVETGDIENLFASSATQRVKKLNDHSVEIDVRSLRPDTELGTDYAKEDPPSPDDLETNNFIQSDDQQIQELAKQIEPGNPSKWAVAVALERNVKETVHIKSFSQALSSAAEVLRTREGDCTEHSVLLAALCRARQIPARVAIGLVYYPQAYGFAYHMWTTVWINDRWIPLDSTLGAGGIGAAHLMVSSSSLKGVDPLTQFLPVLQLMGNLKLEIVSAE